MTLFRICRSILIISVVPVVAVLLSLPTWTTGTQISSKSPAQPATAQNEKLNTEELTKLAGHARSFFKDYCAKCHHGDDSWVEDYDVLDYKSLTKKRTDEEGNDWYYVKPGVRGSEALKVSELWKRAGVKGVAGAKANMPPRRETKKPTDKERNDILRKWIEAGASPWPAEELASVDKSMLWSQVHYVFKQRCLKCHDGPGSQSDVKDFDISSYASLTKKRSSRDLKDYPWNKEYGWNKSPWYYAKTGKPNQSLLAESLLYHVIKTNRMPKSGRKLTAEEKKIVKNWLEAGAPGPPPTKARRILALKDQLKAIIKHLSKTRETERPFQRYFTFTNLHNNRAVLDTDLNFYRAGFAKLINSLSWNPKVVIPRALPGSDDTVYVVNLFEMGWARKGVWEQVLKMYPYGVKHGAESAQIERLSGTPLPFVRADWFVANASRPPLYHLLLELPTTSTSLEKQLGIDFIQNFRLGKLARAGYLGASTTTSGFRVVERQEINRYYQGGFWKSYDFGNGPKSSAKAHPLRFPLGPVFPNHPLPETAFVHDGSEVIFSLPNGLQGYMVTDRNGRRMDAPPIWVLKDKNEFSGTPQLVNGISCMGCHVGGMHSVKDQVQIQVQGRKFDPRSMDHVKRIYVSQATMKKLLEGDAKRFEDAVAAVTNPFLLADRRRGVPEPDSEVIFSFADKYRQRIGLASLAWELDYVNPDDLKKELTAKPNIWKGLFIKGRLLAGIRISRFEWERVYSDAVRRLKRGQPLAKLAAPPGK